MACEYVFTMLWFDHVLQMLAVIWQRNLDCLKESPCNFIKAKSNWWANFNYCFSLSFIKKRGVSITQLRGKHPGITITPSHIRSDNILILMLYTIITLIKLYFWFNNCIWILLEFCVYTVWYRSQYKCNTCQEMLYPVNNHSISFSACIMCNRVDIPATLWLF